MTNPTRTRSRFTPPQKAEAVELCLQESLSCDAVAELNRLRKENRELRREKDCSSWRQRTLP